MKIVLEEEPDEEQCLALLVFLLERGVDCFAWSFAYGEKSGLEESERFSKKLEPFYLGHRDLEDTVSDAVKDDVDPVDLFAVVQCWRFTSEVIEIILDSCEGELMAYEVDICPCDWTFYRRGRLVFGILTHHGYAELRLGLDEYEDFKQLGISHRVEK